MEQTTFKQFLGLLLEVLLISTSGVLGRYIALPTEIIIWFRSFLAVIFLYIFLKIKKTSLKVQHPKEYIPFLIGGILMGAHWITYFYALKLSNVALGMLSLYTFPVIIAILEPLILKVKFQAIHLFFGVLILIGLYILTPKFDLESTTSFSAWGSFRLGLVTNLTNAKAAVYAVAFIPAFIPMETSLAFGIIALGTVWALISISWNIGLIWTVKKSATYIQKPSVRRALTAVSAVGILGIAITLALS